MSQIEIEMRLQHWGTWTYSFVNNEQGWPEENTLYRFQREGFVGNDNKTKTSSILYKHNAYAEPVDALFQQLKKGNVRLAQAFYVYYAIPRSILNIKQFSKMIKVHESTFYKRLKLAKRWIAERLPD